MSVRVDSKKRVVLAGARPGDEFEVQASGEGIFVLRKLAPIQDRPVRVKFEKRGRYTVGVTSKTVSAQALKEMLADFP